VVLGVYSLDKLLVAWSRATVRAALGPSPGWAALGQTSVYQIIADYRKEAEAAAA